MKPKSITSNLWLGLIGLLFFWSVANASAFYQFVSLINRYASKSPVQPESVVAEFGRAVVEERINSKAFFNADRGPASATTVAGMQTTEKLTAAQNLQEYLKKPEQEAGAEEIHRVLGTAMSPTIVACLVANLHTESIETADVEASQSAMETFRANPQASIGELKDAMLKFGSVHGHSRERQILFEITQSLVNRSPNPSVENKQTLEEMEAILRKDSQ